MAGYADRLSKEGQFRLDHGIKFDAVKVFDAAIGMIGHPTDWAGIWAPIVQWISAPTVKRPVYGWTQNFQWAICKSKPMIRIYDGNERLVLLFTGPGCSRFQVYGKPETATKIAMFAEQIGEQMGWVIDDGKELPKHVATFVNARQRLNDEKFPGWHAGLSREMREDPMAQMMIANYRREYQAVKDECQQEMVIGLLNVASLIGARFMSLTRRDIIVYEGIRTDGGDPIAWEIAKVLDVFSSGNANVAEVSLHQCLPDDAQGIYDLRGGVGQNPKPIHIYLHPQTAVWRVVEQPYDGGDLEAWMARSGAQGEPKRRY